MKEILKSAGWLVLLLLFIAFVAELPKLLVFLPSLLPSTTTDLVVLMLFIIIMELDAIRKRMPGTPEEKEYEYHQSLLEVKKH